MKDFSSEHVLLTGGTGFFGRALLRNWLNQYVNGEKITRVCVLSRSPNEFLKKYPEFRELDWLKFHKGDILRPSTFPQDEIFSHILHAAADSTIGPKLRPLERYIQIIDGTRNMLEYAVIKKIPKFLFTSSGGVYGLQPKELMAIPEEYNGMPDPLDAENAYGVAKRSAEHMCMLYKQTYGIHVIIARCFAFIGRDLPLDAHFAIGNFIYDAINSKQITVKNNGDPIRTYMDQRDLALWLDKLLFEGENGEAYNIGSDKAISIKELAYLVRDIISPKKEVIFLKQKESIRRNIYIPSIKKMEQEFNIKSKYNLEQSIKEFKI